jgi:hypothetical protein
VDALYVIRSPPPDVAGEDFGVIADDTACCYVGADVTDVMGGDARIAVLVRASARSVCPASAREWLTLAASNLTYFSFSAVREAADLDAAEQAVWLYLQRTTAESGERASADP